MTKYANRRSPVFLILVRPPELELKESLKKYDYPVNIIKNDIKKALEIPQNEFRKANEEQIVYMYKTQSRIRLKSLGEIMFQDLKVPN